MDKETEQIYDNLAESINYLIDASDILIKSVSIGSKASPKRANFDGVSLDIMVRTHDLIEDYVTELSKLAWAMDDQGTWDIDNNTGLQIAMSLANRSNEAAKKFKKIK